MNFMKTIINSIKYWVNRQLENKVDIEEGKMLSSNDYTNEEKEKLASIEPGIAKVIVDSALNAESENPVQNKVIKSELDKKPGKNVEGQEVRTSWNMVEFAGTGAEIFNDTREVSWGEFSPSLSTVQEGNVAYGNYSHAEGSGTVAEGHYSHAEGRRTYASGTSSHAEGERTTADGDYSHVQGKYNIPDTNNKYAHIVGNGDDSICSNAHTLDWEGNAWFAGGLKVGGTGQDDEAAVEVALKTDILSPRDEFILNSSTEGSTKKFKLTIDDDGVLIATEIVESAT